MAFPLRLQVITKLLIFLVILITGNVSLEECYYFNVSYVLIYILNPQLLTLSEVLKQFRIGRDKECFYFHQEGKFILKMPMQVGKIPKQSNLFCWKSFA